MREYRVVVLGAAGVGKSALTTQFVCNDFLEHYNPTIEDSYSHMVTVNNESIALVITDTPEVDGQFSMVHRVSIAVMGFSLYLGTPTSSMTESNTLAPLSGIKEQIMDLKVGEPDIPIILVGTKMDLYMEREVAYATIKDLADSWRVPYFVTSAKANRNVHHVFRELTRRMRERYPDARRGRRRNCIIM